MQQEEPKESQAPRYSSFSETTNLSQCVVSNDTWPCRINTLAHTGKRALRAVTTCFISKYARVCNGEGLGFVRRHLLLERNDLRMSLTKFTLRGPTLQASLAVVLF